LPERTGLGTIFCKESVPMDTNGLSMMNAHSQSTLFAGLWTDHRSIFYKVAKSFTSSVADESDLVQEMLLQLWQSLPRYEGQCKLTTWVYRVCLNTAMTWKRDEMRRLRRIAVDEDGRELLCPLPSPSRSQESSEQLEALYAAIRQLPRTERSLVLLMLDGLSYREISDVAGISENHVGVALSRARKQLGEWMKEQENEH